MHQVKKYMYDQQKNGILAVSFFIGVWWVYLNYGPIKSRKPWLNQKKYQFCLPVKYVI
jgi:hypothetical protein